MLKLLRPNSSNLPCLYSTFQLEYPLVLSRFYFAHHPLKTDSSFPKYFRDISVNSGRIKNLPGLCTGTVKSIPMSKICSPRRGLPSRGCCKSWTRGWIFLSPYNVVVDCFSPTTLNPHNKTKLFCFQKLHHNAFCSENGAS